jgi:hypothetical protein
VPKLGHSAKKLFKIKKTLLGAWAGALSKVIFLKKNFAECPCPGTRQSTFLKKKTLLSAWAGVLGKVI